MQWLHLNSGRHSNRRYLSKVTTEYLILSHVLQRQREGPELSPFLPPSVSVLSALGSSSGILQNNLFGLRFLDIRHQETPEPKVRTSSSLFLSSSLSLSLPLTSASSAGVCHPPLSQTDVCLPVYCSWPGRLVGVQASALSLTLWNTTAVRLLPDSMLMVWFTSPMFNHETEGRREEERERIW